MVETSQESDQYFTQEAFAVWWEQHATDELVRYELLNGRIVMSPASGWPAGECSAIVAQRLRNFVEAARIGRCFGADQTFELPSGDTLVPDFAYVSNSRWVAMGVPRGFLRVVPDLVVEILSPSTSSRDRGEKKAIYEHSGVLEYWIVDAERRRLHQLVAVDGRFGLPVLLDEQATVTATVLAGFAIRVADLLPAQ